MNGAISLVFNNLCLCSVHIFNARSIKIEKISGDGILDIVLIFCHTENVIAIGINGNPVVPYRAGMVGEQVHPTPIYRFFHDLFCAKRSCTIVMQNNVSPVDNSWTFFNFCAPISPNAKIKMNQQCSHRHRSFAVIAAHQFNQLRLIYSIQLFTIKLYCLTRLQHLKVNDFANTLPNI